jgi:hypothetical protein
VKLSHIVVAVLFLLVGGWLGAKYPQVNLLTRVVPAG